MKNIIDKAIAKTFLGAFRDNLKSYNEKPADMTNVQWLENLFMSEIPGITPEKAQNEAGTILRGIQLHEDNVEDLKKANQKGISNEQWLSIKIKNAYNEACQESSVEEANKRIDLLEDSLNYNLLQMEEIRKNLTSDDNIENLPEIEEIKENVQEHRYKTDVVDGGENYADIQVIDLESNDYVEYAMKFGKTSQDTIDLINNSNETNQNIAVPDDQFQDILAHFDENNIDTTIDKISDVVGMRDHGFLRDLRSEILDNINKNGGKFNPNYYNRNNPELRMNTMLNALSLEQAGINTVLFEKTKKLFEGEPIDENFIIDIAEEGVKTKLKVVAAGTIKTLCEKSKLFNKIVPKGTKGTIIGSLASSAINTVDTLSRVFKDEISVQQGVKEIARDSCCEIAGSFTGAMAAKGGASVGGAIGGVIGGPVGVGIGVGIGTVVGGAVGYMAGSKVGEGIHKAASSVSSCVTKMAETVTSAAKTVYNSAKATVSSVVSKVSSGVKSVVSAGKSFLGKLFG